MGLLETLGGFHLYSRSKLVVNFYSEVLRVPPMGGMWGTSFI